MVTQVTKDFRKNGFDLKVQCTLSDELHRRLRALGSKLGKRETVFKININ